MMTGEVKAAIAIGCSGLSHGPWESLPLGGWRCEKCRITPLGAWKEARNEVASLGARIVELETENACMARQLAEPADSQLRIAELESQIDEMKLCGFVTGSERPLAANSYLGDVDVCLNERPCADHPPEAWITEVNRREACEEALAIANAERLTDEALEQVAWNYVSRWVLHNPSPIDSFVKGLADMLRAAQGAKEGSWQRDQIPKATSSESLTADEAVANDAALNAARKEHP